MRTHLTTPLLALLLAAAPASAQTTYTWNGPYGGTRFWASADWQPGGVGVPPPSDPTTRLLLPQPSASPTFFLNNLNVGAGPEGFVLNRLTFANAGQLVGHSH